MVWKCFCRVYQFAFKVVAKILPWRSPVIISGENCNGQLVEILKQKNLSQILLVTDETLFQLGMCKELMQEATKNGIGITVFKDVSPNPTIDNVEEAFKAYRDNTCQGVIAFGGGSVIDCAKAAGARVVKPKKPVAKMAGVLKILKRLPPFFAIPTTAGTGSEATLAAVITDSKTHRKFAINDINLIPHYAVLDPMLTVNLPKSLTAGTGMDALTHAIEAYIGRSNTKDTKRNAEKAFKLIKQSLLNAYLDGHDIEARQNMLMASHYAGLAFTKAYVGNVHAAAHTLSGFYGTPHGFANAVLLPCVLEYYGKRVYKKLARIANVMEIGLDLNTTEEKAKALIAYIKELNQKMNIPDKIGGIKDEHLPQMIKNALKEANPLYPVPVIWNKRDFMNIFESIRE